MADEKALKSAYELAMERLKKSDEASGIESNPLTDAQRSAIAEVRNFYESKLAEQQVLHQSRMRASVDPAQRDTFEDEYRRDRERLTSERDSKIEKLRRQA
jgi:LPS O-antigen subunit length determinant protein (WzzB/FepE family)